MLTIDYKAAREHVLANYPNDPLLRHIVITALEQLPKVDAVEVVRCKDCFADGCCSVQIDLGMDNDGYCPKGRKENKRDLHTACTTGMTPGGSMGSCAASWFMPGRRSRPWRSSGRRPGSSPCGRSNHAESNNQA